jgi:hypothetical protein
MKDIDEIRRDNLRLLEQELGGPSEAASKVGMSPAQFINLRDGARDSKTGRPRGMRKATARRIEAATGKSEGWLDKDHSSALDDKFSPEASDVVRMYSLATEEKQAVVNFILNDRSLPEWVDSDARAYADSLEAKARRWLNGKRRPGAKEASA